MTALAAVDPNGDAVRSLIRGSRRAHKVALTSTLTVLETFVPGRPMPPGLDVLEPQLRAQFGREKRYAATATQPSSPFDLLFAKERAIEQAFARAGRSVGLAGHPGPEPRGAAVSSPATRTSARSSC